VFDRSKTLTELEGDNWGEADYPSNLVVTCHRMRHKPVETLTDGEVRIAIGQQFSLPILVPLALERLEVNPLLEADFHEGDLIKSVLMVKPDFWMTHPVLWQRVDEIAQIVWSKVDAMCDSWHETIEPDLRLTYSTFVERKPV